MPQYSQSIHIASSSLEPLYPWTYAKLHWQHWIPDSKEANIPGIRASWANVQLDQQNLTAYADICGVNLVTDVAFLGDRGWYSHEIPPLYWLSLTAPIQMQLLQGDNLPLSLLTTRLAWIRVLAKQYLHKQTAIDFKFFLTAVEPSALGCQVTLLINAMIQQEIIWQAEVGFVSLGRQKLTEAFRQQQCHLNAQLLKVGYWYVPVDMGRQFARISGDYHPLYVSSLLARMMGYRRDVVQELWLLAAAIAHFPLPPQPFLLEAQFGGPVYNGSKVDLFGLQNPKGYSLQLTTPCQQVPVVSAKVVSY
ncbi:hypothetical protein [Spartinivicinus poritis]|uniref:Uncharacterized protein n=1 Tax=Spartinivicinus poritis TaxID=2994640 RepID=A0ABT5UC28_9GAMM|nr:hypothetical protein [Spartinivicinus sp. A2-2]MDE1463927.1 hypothetical protein [Spartinivicinus sp. A2-2]